MIIAVTSTGDDLEAKLDARFGRASKFILFDTETRDFETVDNVQNMNAPQGAGVQAAETISRLNANALITGHCGPKAFKALEAAGITIFTGAEGTVTEALEALERRELQPSGWADVRGHWS